MDMKTLYENFNNYYMQQEVGLFLDFSKGFKNKGIYNDLL